MLSYFDPDLKYLAHALQLLWHNRFDIFDLLPYSLFCSTVCLQHWISVYKHFVYHKAVTCIFFFQVVTNRPWLLLHFGWLYCDTFLRPICSRMKVNYLKEGHSSVFIIVFNILLCSLVYELPQHHCYIMLINLPMAMENSGCTCIMLKIRIPQLWAKPWLQAKNNKFQQSVIAIASI